MTIILQSSGTGVGVIFLIILAAGFYFLPAIAGRNKRSAGGIFMLNLLLGWTFIGWVIAFVWALSAESPPPVIINQQHAPAPQQVSKIDQLDKLVTMHKEGVLTDEEFTKEKIRLLA